MGICLDTEQTDGSQAFEEGTETWVQNSPRNTRNAITPSAGKFPMHNDAPMQFESPKVPVIFILGGPGSGKVTHCDNLMQEKKEIVHINMSDLLQQYAIGNDVPDYGQLSSKTVTEVLMLEMKMAPQAKTYLVSGYPRSMRDVVEYSEKIQVVNGVILIAWRQKVLERQIDYGAKLGQVVLSLAKMELNNFYKNVIPVAEYFDQSGMLVSIHGERVPADVYKDFRVAVFHILGGQENPPEFTNGTTVTLPTTTTSELPTISSKPVPNAAASLTSNQQAKPASPPRPKTQVISVGGNNVHNTNTPVKQLTYPPVLWVIGGPGSNKAALCTAAARDTGWTHISLGKLLRAATETSDSHHSNDINKLRECIGNGELVPTDIVIKYVENHMASNMEAKGIILDGFPRDMEQVQEFEAKFRQKPTIILLDCSKLQLGKGRLDDSVTAFRRRLEIFRQSSLPMLKAMDNIGRLTIVDGDTDTAPVQEDFKNVVKEHIEYMLSHVQDTQAIPVQSNHVANGHIPVANGHIPNGHIVQNGHIPNGDATLHDLEDTAMQDIETISKRVENTVANGYANGKAQLANGVAKIANGVPKIANGYTKTNQKVPIFTGLNKGQRNGGYSEMNYMDGHI